jgi:hypothetical protein
MKLRGTSLTYVLFASIIIVMVALVAALGFGQTNNASPAAPDCNQRVSAGIPLYVNATAAPVFHVTSTKAVICVNYKFEGARTTYFTTNVQPWFQNGANLSEDQCTATNCPTVTATPASAYHGAGSVVTVAYTITSSANSTGLFLLFQASCSPFILAFGPAPSSVYLTAWTCGPVNVVSGGYRSDNYNVTGVTNIVVMTVPWT